MSCVNLVFSAKISGFRKLIYLLGLSKYHRWIEIKPYSAKSTERKFVPCVLPAMLMLILCVCAWRQKTNKGTLFYNCWAWCSNTHTHTLAGGKKDFLTSKTAICRIDRSACGETGRSDETGRQGALTVKQTHGDESQWESIQASDPPMGPKFIRKHWQAAGQADTWHINLTFNTFNFECNLYARCLDLICFGWHISNSTTKNKV